MKSGMLWMDADSRRSLEEKILRAADYYKAKYGADPDMCFVNPATLQEEETKVGRVTVQHLRTVLPDHFWMGVSTA